MSDSPYTEVGMVVHWFHSGSTNERPAAAVVVAANRGRVDLQVLPAMRIKHAVFHKDDPGRSEVRDAEGFWDYTPLTKTLLAMVEDLGTAAAKPARSGKG